MSALVLMKAMPLTRGHGDLIEFAMNFAGEATVLMDFSENEPLITERIAAIIRVCDETGAEFKVRHYEPQFEADSPSFWEDWKAIIDSTGSYDYVIGSEGYCEKVASLIGAKYIPFDPARDINSVKASKIREYPRIGFPMIHPDMQRFLQTRVTIFGAESTGKTTLSRELAGTFSNSQWLPEWARPYLESAGPEINIEKMTSIWKGQKAIQDKFYENKWLVIQDTDLFSTVGYWMQPHWTVRLDAVPGDLVQDALDRRSDLYIITKSNIPFEPDPLRYGVDKRESPDEYWIDIAEKFELNYVVLDSPDRNQRRQDALEAIDKTARDIIDPLNYDRNGA